MKAAPILRSMIKRVAASAGFKVIAGWRMQNLSYTHRLQLLFKHFAITSIIDVGASAGQFRDRMRSGVGFTGPIYSFEPDPALAAELQRRAAADPGWVIFPGALGAAAGRMTFNLMQDSVYNSFLKPNAGHGAHDDNGSAVAQAVEVDVRTFDAMASTFPDLSHTYLESGRDVVRQVPALQTEVSLVAQYSGSPLMQDSIAAFVDLGFAVADLFLVATNGRHRARV